jgi:hypothetical protein
MFENLNLIFDLQNTLIKSTTDGLVVRAGAVEALARYREFGNRIVVASSMAVVDIEKNLSMGGLYHSDDLYMQVGMSPMLDEFMSRGKLYGEVVTQLGLSSEDASKRLVVTGDMNTDFSAGVWPIVFVHDEKGIDHGFEMYERVVDDIYERGEGHIYQGFNRRFAEPNLRTLDFGNGHRSLYDRYFYPDAGNVEEPRITIACF